MNEFLTVTLIGMLVVVSPGPDFAIVVKNSMMHGRAAGIQGAFGIALANLCHVAINLLGLGLIISQSATAFTVMKVLGAVYLIYLGCQGLRSKPSDKLAQGTEAVGVSEKRHYGFYSGLFTSLLNPKAGLFYLSFFSVILSSQTPILTQIYYGVWISFIALFWFILVSLFFTSAIMRLRMQTYKHWLERFTGGVLILLGLKLLTSKQ